MEPLLCQFSFYRMTSLCHFQDLDELDSMTVDTKINWYFKLGTHQWTNEGLTYLSSFKFSGHLPLRLQCLGRTLFFFFFLNALEELNIGTVVQYYWYRLWSGRNRNLVWQLFIFNYLSNQSPLFSGFVQLFYIFKSTSSRYILFWQSTSSRFSCYVTSHESRFSELWFVELYGQLS